MQDIVRSKRKSRDLPKVLFTSFKRLLLGKKFEIHAAKNSVFKEELHMPGTIFSFDQKVDHYIDRNGGTEQELRDIISQIHWQSKRSVSELVNVIAWYTECEQVCKLAKLSALRRDSVSRLLRDRTELFTK